MANPHMTPKTDRPVTPTRWRHRLNKDIDAGLALGGAGIGLVATGAGWLAASLGSGPAGALLTALAAGLGAGGMGFLGQTVAPARVETIVDQLLTRMSCAGAVAGLNGQVLAANEAWQRQFGNASLEDLVPVESLYRLTRAARRGKTDSEAVQTGQLSALPFQDDTFLWCWQTDQSQSHSQTATTAPSADEFTGVLSRIPFGVVVLDGFDPAQARITMANPAFDRILGKPAVGEVFGDLMAQPSAADLQNEFTAARSDMAISARLAGEPGHDVNIFVARSEAGLVLSVMDVTEQRQMEMQFAQGQKMQAIGQLAGGVAHDFNNLLTAINLRLDELLMRHPVGDPSYPELREISDTSARAGALVRKLLAFSRKQTFKREVLDVGDLISDVSDLMSRVLSEEVKLSISHGRDLPPIRADYSQIETALLNLGTNARDAMRTCDGENSLSIRTYLVGPDAPRAAGFEPKDDEYVVIEVADTGPGIPPEIQTKIFEPFFTTKDVGKGTGLGLATVYGIVKQSDGFIDLKSEVGKGTTFVIYLPAYRQEAGAAAAEAPVPQPSTRPQKKTPETYKPSDLAGHGRILLVEDEDSVRVMAAKLLRTRGYEVLEAADGEEALEIAEDHAGEIDLMISDVVMPGLDGPGLLKAARGYLGDAKVIFISGYAEEEFSNVLSTENVSFLPKPFTVKDLAERVKRELAEPQPESASA